MLLLAAGLVSAEAQVKTGTLQKQEKEVQAEAATEKEQTEEAPEKTENDVKVISGMSILGNQEAPKSLVIVPWKSSEIGNSMDISTMLDDSRQPVDREVFLRALRYYEISTGKKP
jgi:hypothetical protein